MKIIIATVALLATVTACSAAPAAVVVSAPATQVVTTIQPTPKPTPEPTATPAPSPSLTGDLEAWQSYSDKVVEFLQEKQIKAAAVSVALGSGNGEELRTAAQAERTLELIHVDWLDANPPRTCYEVVWNLDRTTSVENAKSLAALKEYILSNKQSDLNKVGTHLEASNEAQDRAIAASDSVVCKP